MKTTYTAAQLGLNVTQRRAPVNRRLARCPGWCGPQPTFACQSPRRWRTMSPVITSPAVPPPVPAVDWHLGSGAAVLPQRCVGGGREYGAGGGGGKHRCLGLGRWSDSCCFALQSSAWSAAGPPARSGSFPAGGAVSRRGRRGRQGLSFCPTKQLPRPSYAAPRPPRLSAAQTTSIAAPMATRAWPRATVRREARR